MEMENSGEQVSRSVNGSTAKGNMSASWPVRDREAELDQTCPVPSGGYVQNTAMKGFGLDDNGMSEACMQ